MVDPVLLSQYSRNKMKCIVICFILECLRKIIILLSYFVLQYLLQLKY